MRLKNHMKQPDLQANLAWKQYMKEAKYKNPSQVSVVQLTGGVQPREKSTKRRDTHCFCQWDEANEDHPPPGRIHPPINQYI